MKNPFFEKIALVVLMGLGAWIGLTLDWQPILARAEELTHFWWLVPVLVFAQGSAFALAMPGSIMFVIIALLYDPLPATAMIVGGGVSGSLAAYAFSRKLGRAWSIRLRGHRLYHLLRDNTSFLMLCAMRMLPGFPHSVINFGSGLLRVPLPRFMASALLGYMVKGMLYATALHNIIEAEDGERGLSMDVLWPLIVLAVLFVAGFAFQKVLEQRKKA